MISTSPSQYKASLAESNIIKADMRLPSSINLHVNVAREPFPAIPPRIHIPLFFIASAYFVTVNGLWPKLFLFWTITLSLCPFPDWKDVLMMLKVSVTTRYKDLSFPYNTAGFWYILWKVGVCFPVETILWHLDDVLFPEYKTTEIQEPVFLLGQPRSGTTMFESLLSEDNERFCSMLLYEMRYPYLCLQYTVDFITQIDTKFFKGNIYKFVLWMGLLNALQESGERKDMRRLRYDLPDEDDLLFFFHTFCHFLLVGFFPDAEAVSFNHRFSDLRKDTRAQYMELHLRAVQKVMYRRGQGRRYLAKWVAGWNGQLDEAKRVYPDAKYVVLVRDPKDSLPSWMKLQGLLAYQMSGNNVLKNHADVRETIIKENIEWFRKEIEFCRTTSRKNLLVLRYTDLIADIPQQVKIMYQFLDQYIEKGSKFHQILQAKKRRQYRHQKTKITASDLLITEGQIESYFPNLLQEIEFSRPPTKTTTSGIFAQD